MSVLLRYKVIAVSLSREGTVQERVSALGTASGHERGAAGHVHDIGGFVGTSENSVAGAGVRVALKGQYHAALAMLREAIELCPDELWLDETPRNAFWRVAYHALFFVHLYLLDAPEDFEPWKGHQGDVQHADGIAGPADPESALPVSPEPYLKSEALAYWDLCDSMVDERVDAMDLGSSTSGFYWYPISKLEHQIVNIRHTAHHAAQLADRVRAARDVGVKWVGSRRGDATPT